MHIVCTNCGAEVPIDHQTVRVPCAHCGAFLFAQLTEGILQVMLSPRIGEGQLETALTGWLSRMEIRERPVMRETALQYRPYWRLQMKRTGGRVLIAADQPSAAELAHLPEPADAARSAVSPTQDSELAEPECLLEAAVARAAALGIPVEESGGERALVYLPVWRVVIELRKVAHTVFVEAVTGIVCSDRPPAMTRREKSRTLGLVALVAFLLFFAQAYRLPAAWLPVTFLLTGVAVYAGVLHLLRQKGW
mgnify:CR=1 FL=1